MSSDRGGIRLQYSKNPFGRRTTRGEGGPGGEPMPGSMGTPAARISHDSEGAGAPAGPLPASPQ